MNEEAQRLNGLQINYRARVWSTFCQTTCHNLSTELGFGIFQCPDATGGDSGKINETQHCS